MPRTLTLIPLLLAAWSSPAWANDSSFEGHGAGVINVSEARVQMLKEHIVIKPLDEIHGRWRAQCEFWFKNLSDQPVTVQIGFPDWWVWGDAPGKYAIKDFEVWVRNQQIKPEHKEVNSKKNDILRAKGTEYQAAYLWSVTFKPNEEVYIKNIYTFGGYSTMSAYNDHLLHNGNYDRIKDQIWYKLPPKKVFEAKKKQEELDDPPNNVNIRHIYDSKPVIWGDSIHATIRYIVTSGRSWAQPIGEAKIEVHLPKGVFPHLMIISPGNYEYKEGVLLWSRKGWTPTEDIEISFLFPIPSEDEALNGPIFNNLEEFNHWMALAKRNRYAPEIYQRVEALIRYLAGQGELKVKIALPTLPEDKPTKRPFTELEHAMLKALEARIK
ncbi:DUF4424 domain-containing protein [Myxococcota bacterium]|nr:DUF4424 domain-containing protein [Myxococcota bacterium]